MHGIAFSMTTVKWAACWHSKRQRTTNTNHSSPLTCFHPLPKNAITTPYPGVPSSLLWIKDTGARGKDKNLAQHPIFLSSLFFFLMLYCIYVAKFVFLLESAFLHVCVLKLKLGFYIDRAAYMFAKHFMPWGSIPISSLLHYNGLEPVPGYQIRMLYLWCSCTKNTVLCGQIPHSNICALSPLVVKVNTLK